MNLLLTALVCAIRPRPLHLTMLLCVVGLARGAQPVVYSTDLFHPHADPDDRFDLATLYALPGIDLKGVVLDQGARQKQHPGRIPVSQLNRLARRQVPVALGLAAPLRAPDDTAVEQDAEYQDGVRLILDTLEASSSPVALVAVGSMRDVAAAFNRQPALCRRRIARVLCFIGEASKADFQEYNVGLDPHAYVGLMRSGLPVSWVPCFDGGPWQNQGHASFWQARHADLLGEAPPGLVQYFIYALEKETVDPLAFLEEPVDPARRSKLFAMTRNLWCTAVFVALTGRGVAWDAASGARFVDLPAQAGAPAPRGLLFDFEAVDVSVTDEGVVRCGPAPGAKPVRRFRVLDAAGYGQGMTAATATLLRQFPGHSSP